MKKHEIYYLDDNNNFVEPDKSTHVRILEHDENGEIKEVFGYASSGLKTPDMDKLNYYCNSINTGNNEEQESKQK